MLHENQLNMKFRILSRLPPNPINQSINHSALSTFLPNTQQTLAQSLDLFDFAPVYPQSCIEKKMENK